MTNKNNSAGKGDKPRHKQNDHFRAEHDRIFRKKKIDPNKKISKIRKHEES